MTASSMEVLQSLQYTNEIMFERIKVLEEEQVVLLAEQEVHHQEMREIRRQLGSMRG